MFLKSLELHGFKSFPEKTVLQFNSGATVIVGPNGSGKSNITDAMRWVLGELSSKSMRGSKMEDVIFIGADGYRPMSYAEVSVTFDNTDQKNRLNSPYDEITVTRRYSRGGDSDYLINRKPCRLRDIYELFMNTGIGREGYSIIGQGRVAEIISKKSEERRGIFEETAGISKFRYKKQEAERKLGEVEANMLRVADIMHELEVRVPPLERESRKARQYLEYFERKKKADVSLWLYDIKKLRADAEKAEADMKLSSHELDLAEDSEKMLSQQNERLFEASQSNKLSSQKLYDEIRALRKQASENESALVRVREEISYARLLTENLMRSKEKLRESSSEEAARRDGLNSRLSVARGEIAKLEASIAAISNDKSIASQKKAELEAEIDQKLSEIRDAERSLADLSVRLGVLGNTMKERDGKREGILDEIASLEAELSSLGSELASAEASIEKYQKAIDGIAAELGETDTKLGELDARAERLIEEKNSSDGRLAALDGRITALVRMQEHFDGYNNSVKFVMNEAKLGRLRGIVGPVSRVIKVKEEYIVAIECTLGAALQNIITESEADAKAAMAALKSSGSGRATFYPVTSVTAQNRSREVESAAGCRGFVGFADSLVEYDARFSNIISSLLARVAVFTDIDSASDAARKTGWRLRAVTLDGQQINAGGSFTGGSVKRDSGMLTRNLQIESLEKDRSALAASISDISARLDSVRASSDELRRKRRIDEEKQKLSEALLRGEASRRDELAAKRDVKLSLSDKLKEDITKIGEEARMSVENIRAIEENIAALKGEISENEAARSELFSEANEFADQAERAGQAIGEAQINLAELKRDEAAIVDSIAVSSERSAALERDIEENEAELIAAHERIENAEGQEAQLSSDERLSSETLEAKENERAALEDNGLEFEKKLNDIRIKLRDITARKENLFRINSKNESRFENLTETIGAMTRRLWDEYELSETSAAELDYPSVNDENRASIAKELTEMKNAIKALGHVNLDAVDEYVTLKERYDNIKLQTDDLTKSRGELTGIISSLEDEMKVMFVDAFNKVNQNFKEVFRELFDGGNAELELTEPSEPLTSGIEIKAAPPGKMVKNLSLLSGGEQSFVAIALIFALIKVNPSPFCIFDEVESALDEINVQRVGRYIKRFSRDMQIIMITHRRGTMEIADDLYGVTMPKHGVSRVFTLKLDEVGDDFAE